jgi:hypothetical protein
MAHQARGRGPTARQARAPALGLARICLWPGSEVETVSVTWTRLLTLVGRRSADIVKVAKVTQRDGKRRADIYCATEMADMVVKVINSSGKLNWGWYARPHEPYVAGSADKLRGSRESQRRPADRRLPW